TFAKWPVGSEVFYHIDAPNNDGLSNECVIDDIVNGANAWSDVTAGINLTHNINPGSGVVGLNEVNDIIMRDESNGSAIAVTYTWYLRKGRQIVEFDMLFYDETWTFYSLSCSPGSCDGDPYGFYIETIATHEFGHGIGIDHNRCPESIMYPYADNCMTNTLTVDDEACVSNLYK
ncbi:MAG: matrixin family metalloprotease, partial [Candidatus Aminicenantes bacterium]